MPYTCNGSLLERDQTFRARLRQGTATGQLSRAIARCVCAFLGALLFGCTWSVPVRTANSGDWLIVPVSVNGFPATFLLDTGATNSTVSNEFASRIGLWPEAKALPVPVDTGTPQPVPDSHYVPLKSFALGSVHARRNSGQAIILDLSNISSLAQENVDGLVGNATLGTADYVLNVDQPTLTLARDLRLSSRPEALALKVDGHGIYLPITINSKMFYFLLDTGSNRTSVTPDVFSALGDVKPELIERTIVSLNHVDTKSIQRFRAAVKLGSVSVPEFVVLVGDANLIGLDLLRFGELSVSVKQERFVFRSLDQDKN